MAQTQHVSLRRRGKWAMGGGGWGGGVGSGGGGGEEEEVRSTKAVYISHFEILHSLVSGSFSFISCED